MFSEKPEIFHESLRAFTEADEFGTAVLVLTVHRPEDSERLADLVLGADAANLAVLWSAGEMSLASRRRLSEAGLAVFEDAARCMRALAARAVVGSASPAEVEPAPLALDAAGRAGVDGGRGARPARRRGRADGPDGALPQRRGGARRRGPARRRGARRQGLGPRPAAQERRRRGGRGRVGRRCRGGRARARRRGGRRRRRPRRRGRSCRRWRRRASS